MIPCSDKATLSYWIRLYRSLSCVDLLQFRHVRTQRTAKRRKCCHSFHSSIDLRPVQLGCGDWRIKYKRLPWNPVVTRVHWHRNGIGTNRYNGFYMFIVYTTKVKMRTCWAPRSGKNGFSLQPLQRGICHGKESIRTQRHTEAGPGRVQLMTRAVGLNAWSSRQAEESEGIGPYL